MDKLKLHTPDLTAANVGKIAALFPNCVTETRADDGTIRQAIDFDLLRQELSTSIVEGPRERYHLDWPGKREALLAANAPIAKTLRPCREESADFDSTKNLFIEGDNLEALKLLQETYLGKVKMIYIDPPYNTGKEFIYSDDFRDSTENYFERSNQTDSDGNRFVANNESNGRFHSDWLTMVYPRLKLARNLMTDDGAIFISIDDNEVQNLRKLCDEVFGAEQFVATIVWQKRYSRENRGSIGDAHEYVLVYSKQIDEFSKQSGRIPLSEEQAKVYRNPNNDPGGRWRGIPMTAQGFRPNQMYEITTPSGNVFTPPEGRCWSTVEPEYLKLRESGRIYFGKDQTSQPQIIRYLTEVEGLVPWTWLPHDEGGHTDESKKEIYEVFGKGFGFDTPKPTKLLIRLLEIASKDDDFLVLDFFSGSSTTAHAAMKLNADRSGSRRFIMVQLPEPCNGETGSAVEGYSSIADIGKERIRRAGRSIRSNLESQLAGELPGSEVYEDITTRIANLDIGFRVLKIDTSNMEDVYYSPDSVKQDDLLAQADNLKQGRTPEDLLFQVLLDLGLDLALPITKETIEGKTVFFVDENALAACFDPQLSEEFVKQLARRRTAQDLPLLRAVFRDSSYGSDSVKINVEQIFKLLSPGTELKTL